MKLLIISGTPKTDGLTYSFVTAAEETAINEKIEAEVVTLSKMNLSKCKMCGDGWGVCFREHYCAFGDDDGFNALQKKVQDADAYVYITPVYWGEISEEFKTFIDKLRRCQATKQWDSRTEEVSFLKGKPSILVAVAGGGGGGILSTLRGFERAIEQMGGDSHPREQAGIFDYIAVNRWNKEYKRTALKEAIKKLIQFKTGPKISAVRPLPEYRLHLTFSNKEERILDMKPYLNKGRYTELKDVELFNQVKVVGLKVEWRPLTDVDSDILYSESVPAE